ncbi:MAG: transcription elongation factor GreA [Anaerolineales bacterium]|nr:transcription elongation factor GreA [Anaerolineales bacterium]MCS7249172.1 transcription elongation factor GreA [Anaerolineales bacterium]MDW8162985.1 transcription elongation factor GreA [Anaerolineales bacterium]MDW8446768.1 transcription elongation factor GreA [Anaerolineales bacterium]
MNEPPILTAQGAAKLREELEYLTTVARKEIAERLRHAVSQGDLSENADYHKAKEDQAFLEGRIQELEYLLKNAIIVEENHGPVEEVQVGTTVTVQEGNFPPETYTIVGAKEADPRNGKISNESPIGSALLGHKVGDVVTAQTPSGKVTLKILRIE